MLLPLLWRAVVKSNSQNHKICLQPSTLSAVSFCIEGVGAHPNFDTGEEQKKHLKPRKLSQHPCCSWLKRKLISGFGHVVPQMYLSLLWISFHIVSWVFSIFVITFLYYLNSLFSLYDMTMLFFSPYMASAPTLL